MKVVVVPVYRKHWLYHAWAEAAPQASRQADSIDWRKGATLGDKVQLLRKEMGYKAREGGHTHESARLTHASAGMHTVCVSSPPGCARHIVC